MEGIIETMKKVFPSSQKNEEASNKQQQRQNQGEGPHIQCPAGTSPSELMVTPTVVENSIEADSSSANPFASHSQPTQTVANTPSTNNTGTNTITTETLASSPSSRQSMESISNEPVRIYGVCLVGFDHTIGPMIEFTFPESLSRNMELYKSLPFFALPDGAHTRDEDYSYFHLLLPTITAPSRPKTIFGISCNRQIASSELLTKSKGVTRSTVQKAIVVLASKPIFGPLRDKLGVVTRAFFAQKDFSDKSILVDLFSSLDQTVLATEEVEEGGEGKADDVSPSTSSPFTSSPGAEMANGKEKSKVDEMPNPKNHTKEGDEDEGGLYMGTSLRELVYKFRFKTLMLLKLLMLQRKVMFYAAHTPVEQLCTFQYSLVALIPSLLTHLEDAASPTLDERARNTTPSTSLKTSDKQSLIRYLGLPLNIFGKGAFFQPYLPLQQIDYLTQTSSFLVGTTNSIFQQQRDCQIDVIVNLDNATLDILDPKLVPLLTLTAADRKWMDVIVNTVTDSWRGEDPMKKPYDSGFVGSEDFLRAKFEEYLCSLLACIKFTDFLSRGDQSDLLFSGSDLDSNVNASFNESFVKAFQRTPAFELWNRTTDSAIFDLVEPKHPMEGKTNPIEDVGIRLAHGLHDLHLEENLAPTREAIQRGITSGSDSLWKTYSSLRTDISKRQNEYRERREKGKLSGLSGGRPDDGLVAQGPILTTTVLAGVDVAKAGAANIATGLGSLFSAGRNQLFATKGGGSMESEMVVSSSGSRSAPATRRGSERTVSDSLNPSTTSTGLPSTGFGGLLQRAQSFGSANDSTSALNVNSGRDSGSPSSLQATLLPFSQAEKGQALNGSATDSSSIGNSNGNPNDGGAGGLFNSFRRSWSYSNERLTHRAPSPSSTPTTPPPLLQNSTSSSSRTLSTGESTSPRERLAAPPSS